MGKEKREKISEEEKAGEKGMGMNVTRRSESERTAQ